MGNECGLLGLHHAQNYFVHAYNKTRQMNYQNISVEVNRQNEHLQPNVA